MSKSGSRRLGRGLSELFQQTQGRRIHGSRLDRSQRAMINCGILLSLNRNQSITKVQLSGNEEMAKSIIPSFEMV